MDFMNAAVKKLEDKYKKIYKNDDDAFAIWQSQMYTIFNDGAENMRTAGTTRGFGESECKDITNWICDICDDLENQSVIDEVRAKVEELCSR